MSLETGRASCSQLTLVIFVFSDRKQYPLWLDIHFWESQLLSELQPSREKRGKEKRGTKQGRNGKKAEGGSREERKDEGREEGKAGELGSLNRAEVSLARECDQGISSVFILG